VYELWRNRRWYYMCYPFLFKRILNAHNTARSMHGISSGGSGRSTTHITCQLKRAAAAPDSSNSIAPSANYGHPSCLQRPKGGQIYCFPIIMKLER
jgi:hypothetical protein